VKRPVRVWAGFNREEAEGHDGLNDVGRLRSAGRQHALTEILPCLIESR